MLCSKGAKRVLTNRTLFRFSRGTLDFFARGGMPRDDDGLSDSDKLRAERRQELSTIDGMLR